ncbi:MAG: Nif11-like leader peptide family natural product precursor [Thermostichus sp. DG02_5_bins_236]
MGREAATDFLLNDFLDQVAQDEQLMHQLVLALEEDDDRAAVASLAVSKGFDITPDELWEEVKSRQQEIVRHQDKGELSDDELEAIAGGGLLLTGLVGFFVSGGGRGFAICPAKW